MNKRILLLAAAFALVPTFAHAGSFVDEISRIKADKGITCPANRMQPADSLMGAMWSCRSENDEVKLYVSEERGEPGTLKRILLKAERPANGNFTIEHRDFITSVLRHYFGADNSEVVISFFSCTEQLSTLSDYSVEIRCSQGTSIRSHSAILYPKK